MRVLQSLLAAFSVPTDGLRWSCLGFAALLVFFGPNALRYQRVPRWLWWLAPLTAGALSWAYIGFYLRGGPRIIDATAYYLEARTFAAGMFTVPLPEPEHAVMGRFLVRASTGAPSAAVIFPPGYPAVLALGFLAGAPLAVGPVLAALLVAATMDLTRRLCRRMDIAAGTPVTYAALASVACATLRYHTADTMSHGLAALCMTLALSSFLALLEHPRSLAAGSVLGLSGGWLFATRPASALALAVAVGLGWMICTRWRARAWVGIGLGVLPPVALWLAYQHAVTGTPWATAQGLYYAASDGPPGCFRYGFGEGIGCLGEHGTFVQANLADGYGLVAATKTTGRRLMTHVWDGFGFAPAFAAWVAGAFFAWRDRGGRIVVGVVGLLWLAYAPFYFDGNYPGGGARMFVDVLPAQHAIAAAALGSWKVGTLRPTSPRAAAWLLASTFVGFAFYGGTQHELLREREGGRPMFDSRVAVAAEDTLFIDTDHGFNLAFDPGAPTRVARRHHDALDGLTLQSHMRGRRRVRQYRYDFSTGRGDLADVQLDPGHIIEGESLWPARAQTQSFAFPRHYGGACVSRGRALAIAPSDPDNEVRLAIPKAWAGALIRLVGVPTQQETTVISKLYSHEQALSAVRQVVPSGGDCATLAEMRIPGGSEGIVLGVRTTATIALDRIERLQNR